MEIQLSKSVGGYSNTALTEWVTNPISLVKELYSPVIGAKDGPYFIRCTGTKRNNADTADIASVLILDGDSRIDEDGEIVSGAPNPELLHDFLTSLGVMHIIYSSHSNGATQSELEAKVEAAKAKGKVFNYGGAYGEDYHKYRVVIPCTYTPEQLPMLLGYLFDELHKAGAMLAPVNENKAWSQPWYLPRVPDEQRRAMFKSFWRLGKQLDVDAVTKDWLKEHPEKPEPQFSEPRQPIDESNGRINSLKEFNQSYSCADILIRNGYTKKGLKYLRPGSESKNPGVQLCKERKNGVEGVYSHGGDVLNDGFPHDAFDCMRLLEKGGDWKSSLRWSDSINDHNTAIWKSEQSKASHASAGRENAKQESADSEKPSTTHNDTLDNNSHYCKVDFLQHIDDNHLLKQMALNISEATDLPAHTVFIAGLGVFSSITSRAYKVNYQFGGDLPCGLYAVLEQPPGTAKSRALKLFQKPIYEAATEANLESSMFTTNSTPEALEKTLLKSGGYFSAVSSEQGLFNTLLGACYSGDKTSNNDLLLNGFDAGFIATERISREGYRGIAVGNAVMFAQQGGIETLLKQSNGTGLAERFLLIAEKHSLGTRDFSKSLCIDNALVKRYSDLVIGIAVPALSEKKEYKSLPSFSISDTGWQMIKDYRQSIERHLADGGRYSNKAIRGAAAKVDIQIMKIAANLQASEVIQDTIADKHVKAAISIASAMIEANLKLCIDKGIIGARAEYNSILSLFEENPKPRTERNIIQSKSGQLPFRDFTGNKSDLIRDTLAFMVKDSILKLVYTVDSKPIKQYAVAQ